MQISKLKIIFVVLLQLAFIGQVVASTHSYSTFDQPMVDVDMTSKAQCLDVMGHEQMSADQSGCCEVDCDFCSCVTSLVSEPLFAPLQAKMVLVIQYAGLTLNHFQASLYRPPITH